MFAIHGNHSEALAEIDMADFIDALEAIFERPGLRDGTTVAHNFPRRRLVAVSMHPPVAVRVLRTVERRRQENVSTIEEARERVRKCARQKSL